MRVYENKGPLWTPNIDPKLVGSPYIEDPNKVPLMSSTPTKGTARHTATRALNSPKP